MVFLESSLGFFFLFLFVYIEIGLKMGGVEWLKRRNGHRDG